MRKDERKTNQNDLSPLKECIDALLTERIRGAGFKLSHLEGMDSAEDVREYASKYLDFLGKGTSRATYLLSSRKVLKVAMNEKGIAQNEAEVDIYNTLPAARPVITKVFRYDPDYKWVISELVKPLHGEHGDYANEFGSRYGIHFEEFADALAAAMKRPGSEADHFRHVIDDYSTGPGDDYSDYFSFFNDVLKTVKSGKLKMEDVTWHEHWGFTPDNRIVILDYGFTEDVESKLFPRHLFCGRGSVDYGFTEDVAMTRQFLKEYISEMLSEKVRDPGFKDAKLRRFDSTQDVYLYAASHLKELGRGTSRAAFLYSSKKALKVALNEKGIAQNEAEVGVWKLPATRAVVARVYESDPEFKWVVSELVKPLEDKYVKSFYDKYGVPFVEFARALKTARNSETEAEAHLADVAENFESHPGHEDYFKFFRAALETVALGSLMIGDVEEPDHWGVSPDGRIVLLDYGFTREVADKHYPKKKKDPSSADVTKKMPTRGS